MITPSYTDASSVTLTSGQRCLWWKHLHGYGVMVGMLRDRFMMRRTSTSGRLSCLVWAQPSSAAAMCRSKRSDTDFFLSLGFPRKKEPSHCFITLSIFSVLKSSVFNIYISVTQSLSSLNKSADVRKKHAPIPGFTNSIVDYYIDITAIHQTLLVVKGSLLERWFRLGNMMVIPISVGSAFGTIIKNQKLQDLLPMHKHCCLTCYMMCDL